MKKTQPFLLHELVTYENPYFKVIDRYYRFPDGSKHHFYITQEVDTCCVLAMTDDSFFITVKEFRPGPQKDMTELPAGRLESWDENPDKRIKKELLEETGYIGDFKKIGVLPTSPYSTRYIHCYYAVHCKKISDQKLDQTEFIDVFLLDQQEMKKNLMSGQSSSCSPGILAWECLKNDGYLNMT